MKIKGQFILSDIADEQVAVSVGEAEGFRGIVRLNETGAFVFRGLQDGKTEDRIADDLVASYKNVDRETALKAVKIVIDKLKAEGLLEED